MKKAPAPTKVTTSAPRKRNYRQPITERQARVIKVLLRRKEIWREDIDRIAGASNGPEVIRQLRDDLSLIIHCRRVLVRDRDGCPSRPGKYRLDKRSNVLATKLLGSKK